MNDLDLDTRGGLPGEWLALLRRHPRANWQKPGALGMTAAFWLDRHAAFRALGETLEQATQQFLGGGSDAADFQGFFVPRLRVLLGELHGHHQVEDHHYFPAFRRAEPGLAPGFDLLDRDHQALHADLHATAEAANALLQALARTPDAEGPAAAYAETSARLLRRMKRHLDDEEDLVIPLLMEHGELVG
ncbi:MAG: hemerythrin domain-containing protein [Kiloniellaceae bacterium]